MIYSEDVIEEIHDCGNWKFKFYLLINKYWEGVKSMQIKKLRVTNVASLVDFHNDTAFEKNNIIFGTNGSGKSTLVELLHLLNKYHLHKDAETETELKDFLRGRFSKELIYIQFCQRCFYISKTKFVSVFQYYLIIFKITLFAK